MSTSDCCRPLDSWRKRIAKLEAELKRLNEMPINPAFDQLKAQLRAAEGRGVWLWHKLQATATAIGTIRDWKRWYHQAVEEGASVLDQYEEANAHLEAAEDTLEEQHGTIAALAIGLGSAVRALHDCDSCWGGPGAHAFADKYHVGPESKDSECPCVCHEDDDAANVGAALLAYLPAASVAILDEAEQGRRLRDAQEKVTNAYCCPACSFLAPMKITGTLGRCSTCGGNGRLRINVNDPNWEPGPLRTRQCPDCRGTAAPVAVLAAAEREQGLREALDWYAEQGHWRQDGPTGFYRISAA